VTVPGNDNPANDGPADNPTGGNPGDANPADSASVQIQTRGLTDHDVVLVMTTVPDRMLAKYLAHALVEDGVVACANLGASCLSMYMWQGELQGDEEVPLLLKTSAARLPELAQRLHWQHPYELPEFLVLPVAGGTKGYLDWVRAGTAAVRQP